MKRVAVIQPLLTEYRLPVHLELSNYCYVDLIYSPVHGALGFGEVKRRECKNIRYFEVPTLRPFGEKFFMIQRGLARYLLRERPDTVVIFANPRYLTFWTTLVVARLLGIQSFAHGHGLYKWTKVNPFVRVVVRLMLWLATGYIAYAPVVRESFGRHAFSEDKIAVAPNSLQVDWVVKPEEKSGMERGILFVGRLRKDCNADHLFRTVSRLREEENLSLHVEVVGSGECEGQLREQYGSHSWIHWHGASYDPVKLRQISSNCFIGCYPGDAGLSVLHMMALSLPPVTHNRISRHKGPEPSFIQHGVSGMLYDYDGGEASLYQALLVLARDRQLVGRMQRAAFARYQELTHPSLAMHLWRIIGTEVQGTSGFSKAVAS